MSVRHYAAVCILAFVIESDGQLTNRRLQEGVKAGLILTLVVVLVGTAVDAPLLIILGPKSFVGVMAVSIPVAMVVMIIGGVATVRRLNRKWANE